MKATDRYFVALDKKQQVHYSLWPRVDREYHSLTGGLTSSLQTEIITATQVIYFYIFFALLFVEFVSLQGFSDH